MARDRRAIGPPFWGGPIVNLKGEVVGVTAPVPNQAPFLSGSHHVLPAGRIRRIVGDLAQFGQVRRGYLGVQVEPDGVRAGAPNAPGGVVISTVGNGSPAGAAGLRPGDRIVSANGRKLTVVGQLQAAVEETPIGEELTLLVDRNGGRLEVKVRPQAQPGPAEAPGMPRSRIEGAPRTNPGPGRVRSRVVPAQPAPRPANPTDSSDPTSLEPIPGADSSAQPPPLPSCPRVVFNELTTPGHDTQPAGGMTHLSRRSFLLEFDDSSKDGRAVMRRRILVIDDMEFNRHHLKKVLESDDLEVDTKEDGRSAWDRLRAQKYHLVITDLRMPEVGGHELLGRIRQEKLPLGVIVLTAFGDPGVALRAMKAGS